MYLKSLTLKGFKSFASSTTLRFEPGICCVVGPNGSGKSNVVDALTWVMGEQGAKSLRGASMQDVIFAGTTGRAALGRAEVTLTLDNTDGALPIDYAEVSVTRRMFRDGAGEYEINGSKCRLMDVQELLSDSGIGREMHVIVGQGKLAEILESKPEDRRAFIEEAAGILKHRRRKEKAQRKLTAMQGNLDRLHDLTTELRRQLKPLGRQAEVARRAQTIQADVRDARLRIAADDLLVRRTELADTTFVRENIETQRKTSLDIQNAAADRLEQAEKDLAEVAPQANSAQLEWFQLSTLAERARATARISADRAETLAGEQVYHSAIDPQDLERQAVRADETETQLAAEADSAQAAQKLATGVLEAAEKIVRSLDDAHLAAVRAIADRREGLARLAGQADTLQARLDSGAEDINRLERALADSNTAVAEAALALEGSQAGIVEHAEVETSLDDAHVRADAAHRAATERKDVLTSQEREAAHIIAGLAARIEAWQQSIDSSDGAAWLLDAQMDGITGTLLGQMSVEAGWEKALSAALGQGAQALVAQSVHFADEAIAALGTGKGGRAAVVAEHAGGSTYRLDIPLLPGGSWALDRIVIPDTLNEAMTSLLVDIVFTADVATARSQVEADSRITAVTVDGDIVGAKWIVGGSDPLPSGVEIQARVDIAQRELIEARRTAETAAAELIGAHTEFDQRRIEREDTLAALHESDARINGLYEQLARLGQTHRRSEAEMLRLNHSLESARTKRDKTRAEHTEILARLTAAERQPGDESLPQEGERDCAQQDLARSRSFEIDARMALRSVQDKLAAAAGKGASLRRAAQQEIQARSRAEHAAATRRRASSVAAVIAELAAELLLRIDTRIAEIGANRDALSERKDVLDTELAAAKGDLRDAEKVVSRLSDEAHRDEIVRAQLEVTVAQMEESVLERLGIDPDALVAEYGPHIPLDPSADQLTEFELARERGETVVRPQGGVFDRVEQQRRLKRAETDLATLGKVNPLALEEFAALEERYTFLSTQLDDVKKARTDLLGVIDDVDDHIERIFTEAYADVEREFVTVFDTLFPGGEGRLVLTDPSDMLTTGIEVEARPPGKKVKRLSLLSGGEKSLTAVAMLVAIFKARPSPFYVMDEVEAALDDVNLRRLISLFEQLRETSQLIVITHQKPTMDVADVLYGVSMQGDGISAVISQRMRGTMVPVDVH